MFMPLKVLEQYLENNSEKEPTLLARTFLAKISLESPLKVFLQLKVSSFNSH